MIGKDGKINHLYVKSKLTFKTFFRMLSKLTEQVKLHLHYKFKSFYAKEKILNDLF